MVNYTRSMKQDATYWAPGTNDGNGDLDFSGVVPVAVVCRWQEDTELFIDSNGQEFRSNAVVYTTTPVKLRGYLALGTYTEADPRDVEKAYEIRKVIETPSLRNYQVLNQAVL
jgi:hypothetical protein